VGSDGRYYLYYAFDFQGIISVAVCDTPAGEYEFYGHVHYRDKTLLGKKDGDAFQFDPGILVDDDGRVFLYSGFCPADGPSEDFSFPPIVVKGGMVTELEKDMLTVKKGPRYIFPWIKNGEGTGFEEHEFFEAASIRKIGNKYYFIYSSINGHELCYGVSDYPDKDFQYGGILISNGDIGLDERSEEEAVNYIGNNHGSIVCIKDQWYVFYHRHTNRTQFSRQGCAEKITLEENGFFSQAEMTSCGLNDGPLCKKGEYEARIACNLMSKKGVVRYEVWGKIEDIHPYFTQEGEDREDNPNQYIANLRDGGVAGFKYFDLSGVEKITVTIRGTGKGMICVGTEPGEAELVKIPVKASFKWKEYHGIINNGDGIRALFFEYEGDGIIDFLKFRLG
jgi:hypothetical protein